jgi:hypothetical protein
MPRFRFSIGGLMAAIVLIAIAIAGLRYPSPFWANVWFSLPLGALAVAIPAAVYSRGGRRAFLVGFATCGWVYFVVALCPWFETESFQLVTTTVLDLAAPQLVDTGNLLQTYVGGYRPPRAPVSPTPWQRWNLPEFPSPGQTLVGYVPVHSPGLYLRIGHGVFCILLALCGGEAVRFFHFKHAHSTGTRS